MSNINSESMDDSNGASGSFKPGTFGMSTDGSVARTSQVQGQELKHDGPSPIKGPGSEGRIDGSYSEDVRSLASSPSTVAAQKLVKEDPKLNITFQFVEKPAADMTVNAAPDIQYYCEMKGRSREIALANSIHRAQVTAIRKFYECYPEENHTYEKCQVTGKEVQGWNGLVGEYFDVSNTVSGIKDPGDM